MKWDSGKMCNGTNVEAFLYWHERKTPTKNSQFWVTVYEVTRHYGGPEEGGWWYNWYHPVKSLRVRVSHLKNRTDALKRKYKKREYGDIYSVRGGEWFEVSIERNLFEHQSLVRPHFE